MPVKPGPRALHIINFYNQYVFDNGQFGAMIECARILKITPQYVSLVVNTYPEKIIIYPETKYKECRICNCDTPTTFMRDRRCRDCIEQNLAKCKMCKSVYRGDGFSYCEDCRIKIHAEWQKNNKEHLAEYRKKNKEKHKEYFANYRTRHGIISNPRILLSPEERKRRVNERARKRYYKNRILKPRVILTPEEKRIRNNERAKEFRDKRRIEIDASYWYYTI